MYGLLTNSWALVICLRKARLLQTVDKQAALAHNALALVNGGFIFMCIVAVAFGFYSPIGYWTFFIFIWLCNLAQIIIYITFSAVPASFQIKIAGFSFVTVVTFLTVVTLVFFPPLLPSELPARMAQQKGLGQMFAIIAGATVFVATVLPALLRQSLTNPVKRLLAGVQQVNAGDLTAHVPVGASDEIGDLTLHFNKMTESLQRANDQLRDYAETLEVKVVERTAALKQSLDDLRTTQAQLVQAEKMASLGELTAGIAHEIQNPLNFVNNFSELGVDMLDELKEELTADHKDEALALADGLTDAFRKITHHGGRAAGIVKSMLEHSRTRTGQREPTDINALCQEFAQLSYSGMQEKDKAFGCQLTLDLDPAVGRLNVIPQDIGRVLLNVLMNAFYAVQEKTTQVQKAGGGAAFTPTVWVRSSATVTASGEPGVVIRIRDNGTGMPESVRAKIFQPFFTTRPTGQGTGLGLSLSYDIVTKGHGGTFGSESIVGEGTEMIIQLANGRSLS